MRTEKIVIQNCINLPRLTSPDTPRFSHPEASKHMDATPSIADSAAREGSCGPEKYETAVRKTECITKQ